jgi:hypothetical protein
MLSARKKVFFVGAAILVLIMSLNVLGIIDFNLYKASFNNNTNYFSSYNKDQGCYDLKIQYHGKIVYRHQFLSSNEAPVEIIAEIEDYQYKGNYYLPLYKKFTLDYKCSFACPKLKEDNISNFSGGVDGSIESEIIGICSVRKAKMLVEEKSLESIKKHLIDTLEKLNRG